MDSVPYLASHLICAGPSCLLPLAIPYSLGHCSLITLS